MHTGPAIERDPGAALGLGGFHHPQRQATLPAPRMAMSSESPTQEAGQPAPQSLYWGFDR